MKTNNIVKLFKEIWDLYNKLIDIDKYDKVNDNSLLLEEFFFVILGGFGINYELNKSGLNVIKRKGLIESHFYRDDTFKKTMNLLRKEFSTNQFEPMTKNKELRKYRFIERKSILVASAGNWLLKECEWELSKWLSVNGKSSRDKLCECPGIGMKSASWFLRNIGYNYGYAVLDIHILRFMSRIGLDIPSKITKEVYIDLEETLRDICRQIDVKLGEMDYLLWMLGRNGYLDYVG